MYTSNVCNIFWAVQSHVNERRSCAQNTRQLRPAQHTVGRAMLLKKLKDRFLMPARVSKFQRHPYPRRQLLKKVV